MCLIFLRPSLTPSSAKTGERKAAAKHRAPKLRIVCKLRSAGSKLCKALFYLYTLVHDATMQGKVERVVSTCTNQNNDFPTRQYVKGVFGHFACARLDSRLVKELWYKDLRLVTKMFQTMRYVLRIDPNRSSVNYIEVIILAWLWDINYYSRNYMNDDLILTHAINSEWYFLFLQIVLPLYLPFHAEWRESEHSWYQSFARGLHVYSTSVRKYSSTNASGIFISAGKSYNTSKC